MQCASAILSSVACTAIQYFSTLSHKRHGVLKSVTERKMCIFIFYATFVWNILILRTEQIWSQMYTSLHVEYPLFLSCFNETSILSKYFWKIIKYKILRKSFQWELRCSVWADGQTDRQTEVNAQRTTVPYSNSVLTDKSYLGLRTCVLYWLHCEFCLWYTGTQVHRYTSTTKCSHWYTFLTIPRTLQYFFSVSLFMNDEELFNLLATDFFS